MVNSLGFDGLVSGMKTTDIIDKLMSIERQPLKSYSRQKSKVQAKDAAYQAIRAKVVAFQSSLNTLMQASSINVKSASVTPPSGTNAIISASATADAVSGTYQVAVTQLATASTLATSKPMSKGVSSSAVLSSAGFTLAPTSGTFTVNGVSITVNPATDTLTTLVNKIKDSTLVGGTGVGTGVNAVITNDANGNPNGITLTPISGTQPVQLGSGADTSNFLTAAHLVATNVAGGAVASNAPLSAATPGNALSTQPFNLAPATTLATSGTFTLNGTTINWANTDSLTTVLNRINTSTAGVKASYDPTADKVSFTNTATGNQAVSISEVASPAGQAGLMSAFGLIGANAVATAGKTAQYAITTNGVAGPTQYSNSNTVTSAIPGVTLNLLATGVNNTLTIAQDTSTASKNVQAMVDTFNQLTDLIDTNVKYDPKTKASSPLTGDSSILGLRARIRSLLATAPVLPPNSTYATLGDIGISTGGYGSAIGTTSSLKLDSTKLNAALQNNPSAVFAVLSGLTGTAGLTNASGTTIATGNSWVQTIAGTPTGQPSSGTYAITYNPSAGVNNASVVFTPVGGSAAPAVTGAVTAGGANTSLIPGLTLTAKGAPVAGTEYVKYTVTNSGVLQNLSAYLSKALATGGVFDAEQVSATAQTKAVDLQVTKLNERLAIRQQTLQKQFAHLEVALGKLQQQNVSMISRLGY
jgi:flagellar hook-associated protein 2